MHQNDPLLKYCGFRPTGDLGPLTAYTTRRNKTTWFLKSPPTKAPSVYQRRQRGRFITIAHLWQQMPPPDRALWLTAAKKANLYLTGYTLWLWFWFHRDRPTIRTIERRTSITLPGLQ